MDANRSRLAISRTSMGLAKASNRKKSTSSSPRSSSRGNSGSMMVSVFAGIIVVAVMFLFFMWEEGGANEFSAQGLNKMVTGFLHKDPNLRPGSQQSQPVDLPTSSAGQSSAVGQSPVAVHVPRIDTSHKPEEPVLKPLSGDDDNEISPERDNTAEIAHLLKKKPKDAYDMHFIHIPKCGGTSMTAILRQISCELDKEKNVDCCTNPGFCDHNDNKRCAVIRGCINHFPQREWIFKNPPSITIIREPVSRILSAWFYRGHTPNNDFFQVRPYFKDIHQGKLPKVEFDEYIAMPEYQNIQTRMLGADSFPYRNVTVDMQVFNSAKEAIDNIFFVGLQEAYDLSVKLLLRELKLDHLNVSVMKERDQSNAGIAKKKKELRENTELMKKTADFNKYDTKLYKYGVRKFCRMLKKHNDLYAELKSSPKTASIC